MADYFAMDHDELTAEKTALEAQYKKFQGMNLKLNMARGKPGPHQMDLAMDLLKICLLYTSHMCSSAMPAVS